MHLQLKQIS